jgi:NADP-dependent 3-hydroxy acid dehydrogenase YdfG
VIEGGTSPTVPVSVRIAISADAVARAIAFAIEQPEDVDINEILRRPTAQEG